MVENIDLGMTLFDYAKRLADQRSKQKEHYMSSNPMSDNYELVGVLGELIYSFVMGEMMDTRLKIAGDDGIDFSKVSVQVKASEEYKAKHLIEYMNKKLNFDYYVFVIVNLEEKTGYIKGWISVSDFIKKRYRRDFGYGYRWTIHLNELNPWKRTVKQEQT